MEKEKHLTSEESFQIITHMIETAKGNLKGKGFYFLLWGWIVLIGSLGHYFLLKFTDVKAPYTIWLIVILGVIASFVYGYRNSQKRRAKSYLERVYVWIWVSFLINYLIINFFIAKIQYNIAPLIWVLAGSSTFLSGIMIKFKPLIGGGIFIWISSVVAFLVARDTQLLVSAIAILGYLIPGYMLQAKAKEENV